MSRKQNKAATTIQLLFKSYLSKKRLFNELKKDLDSNLTYLSNLKEINNLDQNLFELTVRNLLFSFKQQTDANNLSILSHFFIKNKEFICNLISPYDTYQNRPNQKPNYQQINLWIYRLKKLILLNVQALFKLMFNENNQQSTNFVPLRILEVFTSSEFYSKNCKNQDATAIVSSIWNYLIKNNYFYYMKKIFETRVPSPYDEDVPYTPLERNLFDMICRPLNIQLKTNSDRDKLILKEIIIQFFTQFFNGPFSPLIRFHVFKLLNEKLPLLLNFNFLISAIKTDNDEIILPKNIWTLYSLLAICANQLEHIGNVSLDDKFVFVFYIKNMIENLPDQAKSTARHDDYDSDDDEAMQEDDINLQDQELNQISNDSIHILNSVPVVNFLNNTINQLNSESNIKELLYFSSIGNSILINNKTTVYDNRLLYTLSFNSNFLQQLWKYIITVQSSESNTLLIQAISKGVFLCDWKAIVPHFSFFCSLFNYLLPTNDDFVFYDDKDTCENKFSALPFTVNELRSMVIILRDVSLSLVELAYRDHKLSTDYRNAIKDNQSFSHTSESFVDNQLEEFIIEERVKHWSNLFKVVVTLLRQLHNRDSRNQFCPKSSWISSNVSIPINKPLCFKIQKDQLDRFQKFVGLKKLSKRELEKLGPLMSTKDIKNITILKEIPFVIPFTDRVKILHSLIEKDKQVSLNFFLKSFAKKINLNFILQNYGESHHFMIPGSTIDIVIRRNYIYEDAYEKLSYENEPDMKKHIRVQLKNAVGLDEAGIDGGGLGREFLTELTKTAFDPNRGLFKSTTDRTLYPNPSANLVIDNYLKHFYFLGRIFGKMIYENMLSEIPFSHFFLAKLLTKNQASDIDIHFLASLDPLMYKNLLYLKNYQGDVNEMNLDFTVVQSDLGENKIIELKPNGAEIPVTALNRIEYIHLMADYILNKQIRSQVSAFKSGLANCIDLDWIRMFNPRELQILISGAPTPIDLEDLKKNTTYSGGYSAEHHTIVKFWQVVETFNETQKAQLLKFVTSCSRPPLLGKKAIFKRFKNINFYYF